MHWYRRLKRQYFRSFLSPLNALYLDLEHADWERCDMGLGLQILAILIFFIFALTHRLLPFPTWHDTVLNPLIHRLFDIPEWKYNFLIHKVRSKGFWNLDSPHARGIIRFAPRLVSDPAQRKQLVKEYHVLQRERRDSPARCLERIVHAVERLSADKKWRYALMNELEFTLWARGYVEQPSHKRSKQHKQWLLKDIPDPCLHHNPVRYALAASVVEQIVDVFNWRMTQLHMRRDFRAANSQTSFNDVPLPPPRLEEAPAWAARVPKSPQPTVISCPGSKEGVSYEDALAAFEDDRPPSPHFLKRDLVAEKKFMFFA